MGGIYHSEDREYETLDITSLGEGLKLTKKETVELDMRLCESHLGLPSFAGERNLMPEHVAYLVREMKRGTFRPEWVKLITCKCGEPAENLDGDILPAGTDWRMNGQHTCWSRMEMPEKWRCPVELVRYTAKTEHDLRLLYASIDRNRMRTHGQVVNSIIKGTPEFKGFSTKAMKVGPQGFTLWKFGASHLRGRSDPNEVAFLMQTTDAKVTQHVFKFISKLPFRETKFMFRAPVVTAMYASFDKAPQIADSFWTTVADGMNFTSRSDPRLKLREQLMVTAVNMNGHSSGGARKKSSSEEMYRWCIQAWNAHREGKEINLPSLRAVKGVRPVAK